MTRYFEGGGGGGFGALGMRLIALVGIVWGGELGLVDEELHPKEKGLFAF